MECASSAQAHSLPLICSWIVNSNTRLKSLSIWKILYGFHVRVCTCLYIVLNWFYEIFPSPRKKSKRRFTQYIVHRSNYNFIPYLFRKTFRYFGNCPFFKLPIRSLFAFSLMSLHYGILGDSDFECPCIYGILGDSDFMV